MVMSSSSNSYPEFSQYVVGVQNLGDAFEAFGQVKAQVNKKIDEFNEAERDDVQDELADEIKEGLAHCSYLHTIMVDAIDRVTRRENIEEGINKVELEKFLETLKATFETESTILRANLGDESEEDEIVMIPCSNSLGGA